jgi:hypothetical protein
MALKKVILLPLLLTAALLLNTTGAQMASCSGFANANVVQAQAPWYCSTINQAVAYYWSQWYPIALLAVFVSFAIASLIFGLGTLLKNERIRNFGVGEYYEAIASAIIVAMFLSVSAVMFGLVPGLVTGPVNPYVTALNYMSTTITQLQGTVYQLFSISVLDGFYMSINLQICGPGQVICSPKIYQAFSYLIGDFFYIPATALLCLQLDVLALLYTEFWIIIIFMYISIPVFLVPGVILRSLIPTRGLGGMMIAVAIGFYLVLPVLFSIAYYFTATSIAQQAATNTVALQRYGVGVGAQSNALGPSSPLVQALDNIQAGMDSYWLSVLFYPALIMALTYAVIIQVADFIGGMAQLSGRIRV